MPRPISKTGLIEQGEGNYQELLKLINALSDKQLHAKFPDNYLNRNIRDVLTHLHHWHLMFLSWYQEGMAGAKPEMPAKGYSWKTTSELNQVIWSKYQHTSLKESRQLLNQSHKNVMGLIQKHSNEEIFTKKRYPWTGSTSLGSYLISATSSHYLWAYHLIKKCTINRIKK